MQNGNRTREKLRGCKYIGKKSVKKWSTEESEEVTS